MRSGVLRSLSPRPGDHARLSAVASWALFVVLALQMVAVLAQNSPLARVVIGALLSVACVALAWWWQHRFVTGRSSARLDLGAAAILLVTACVLMTWFWTWDVFGLAWAVLLLVTSVWVAIPIVVVTVAVIALESATTGLFFGVMVANLLIAVLLYALTQLTVTLTELRMTREGLARAHVDQDRERISRELHDVMGRTLVTASLRNQVALRILDTDPQGAREQLGQLHRIVASGQEHLRELTTGPIAVSFCQELDSARAALERAGIRLDAAVDPIGTKEVDQAAGLILREAVTNALKCSRPRWVSVTARSEASAFVLVIVNDGAPDQMADSGTGLRALNSMAERLGGSCEAGPKPGHQFRLYARLPPTSALETERTTSR